MAGLPVALLRTLDRRTPSLPSLRHAICAGLIIGALIATRSRAASVAAVLAAMVALLGLARRSRLDSARITLIAGAALLAALVHQRSPMTSRQPPAATVRTAALLPLPAVEAPDMAPPLMRRLLNWDLLRYSLDERTQIWRLAWKGIAEHPLAGVGPGHFRDVSVYYFNAHNLWLHVGVELGAGALVVLALLTIWLCRSVLAIIGRRSDPDPDALAAAAIVVAFLAAGALDVGALHWGSNLIAGSAAGLVLRRSSASG
jgi:O-antigen ligase